MKKQSPPIRVMPSSSIWTYTKGVSEFCTLTARLGIDNTPRRSPLTEVIVYPRGELRLIEYQVNGRTKTTPVLHIPPEGRGEGSYTFKLERISQSQNPQPPMLLMALETSVRLMIWPPAMIRISVRSGSTSRGTPVLWLSKTT
jgi:hypothetical protein